MLVTCPKCSAQISPSLQRCICGEPIQLTEEQLSAIEQEETEFTHQDNAEAASKLMTAGAVMIAIGVTWHVFIFGLSAGQLVGKSTACFIFGVVFVIGGVVKRLTGIE